MKRFLLSFPLSAFLFVACASGEDPREGLTPSETPPPSTGGTVDSGAIGKDAAVTSDANANADAADANQVPQGPKAGDVVFAELHVNPSSPVSDDAGEFVELFNTTDRAIELEECRLDDSGVNGDDYAITSSIVVAPRSLVVLAKAIAPADNGGVPDVSAAYGTAFSLDNSGGTVSLVCHGVVIDTVTFDATWPYAEGTSMQLALSAFTAAANDKKTGWCAAANVYASGQRGSPGTIAGHCP